MSTILKPFLIAVSSSSLPRVAVDPLLVVGRGVCGFLSLRPSPHHRPDAREQGMRLLSVSYNRGGSPQDRACLPEKRVASECQLIVSVAANRLRTADRWLMRYLHRTVYHDVQTRDFAGGRARRVFAYHVER